MNSLRDLAAQLDVKGRIFRERQRDGRDSGETSADQAWQCFQLKC